MTPSLWQLHLLSDLLEPRLIDRGALYGGLELHLIFPNGSFPSPHQVEPPQISDFYSVQSLSYVQLFATPWTVACQASLSITTSHSLLKLMSIESVMPSNHLISVIPFSSCLQSFPASGSFPMSQLFTSGGRSIGVSASASILPMNIQD